MICTIRGVTAYTDHYLLHVTTPSRLRINSFDHRQCDPQPSLQLTVVVVIEHPLSTHEVERPCIPGAAYNGGGSAVWRLTINGVEDIAMRLLQATREQLHGKPTREVEPFEIAQKARINPYSREYETAMRYLL